MKTALTVPPETATIRQQYAQKRKGELCLTKRSVLQGYAIGNGCTDPVVDNDAILPYAFRHTLLSDAAFAALEKACSGNFWNITPGANPPHLHIKSQQSNQK